MKKSINILIIIFSSYIYAQDSHLSQFFISPQLNNPAAFGVINLREAGIQYKSQWNSFTKGYNTYALFGNTQLNNQRNQKGYFSLGINALYDRTGDAALSKLNIALPFNYTVKLNRTNFLTTGVSLGYIQKSFLGNNLTWGTQFNGFNYDASLPNENYIQQTKSNVDIGVGMAWVFKRKQKTISNTTEPKNVMGFSVSHVNKPNFSFYGNSSSNEKLYMLFNFHEYCQIYLTDTKISLTPSFMAQYQGGASEFMIGTMVKYKLKTDSRVTGIYQSSSLNGGLFFRFKDALTLNVSMEHKNYMIGFAYDLNISTLKTVSKSQGGIELFVKIKNPFSYGY